MDGTPKEASSRRENRVEKAGSQDAGVPARSPSAGVGRALRKAARTYNRLLEDRLAAQGMGLAEYLHLRELWLADGLSQIEMARRIGIRKASSTTVLAGLEAKGLIRRRRNAADRRVVNVFLTRLGASRRQEILDTARLAALRAIGDFDAGEVETLLGFLERIERNLTAQDQGEGRNPAA